MSKQTRKQIMERANKLYENAGTVRSLDGAQKALAEASELIYRLAENMPEPTHEVRVGASPEGHMAEGQDGEAD